MTVLNRPGTTLGCTDVTSGYISREAAVRLQCRVSEGFVHVALTQKYKSPLADNHSRGKGTKAASEIKTRHKRQLIFKVTLRMKSETGESQEILETQTNSEHI